MSDLFDPTVPIRVTQTIPGNIDLQNRPLVRNPDGTVSTVRSMSFEEDGREVLVPTVSPDGRILQPREAIDLYRETGQHLGKFPTIRDAEEYAQRLHEAQAKMAEDMETMRQSVLIGRQTDLEAKLKGGM